LFKKLVSATTLSSKGSQGDASWSLSSADSSSKLIERSIS
ncbi:4540_t:CDS:1, partial [Cetraspora pellucida]